MRASLADALAAIRRFFSKEDEPLRRRVYFYVVPALALLVTHGILTADQADLVGGLVGYVLLVPVTEWTRSAVSPTPPGRHRQS